jgi:hypothetical protein
MRLTWASSNPVAAYASGTITPDEYYQITGTWPVGYEGAVGANNGGTWAYGGEGWNPGYQLVPTDGNSGAALNYLGMAVDVKDHGGSYTDIRDALKEDVANGKLSEEEAKTIMHTIGMSMGPR